MITCNRLRIWLPIVLSLIVSGCAPSNEQRVRQRFQDYMDSWERGDLKGVWEMMSSRLKHSTGSDEQKFEDHINNQDFRQSGYTIKSISVGNGTAVVEADVRYSDLNGHPVGVEREDFSFVLNGDTWYFDDYKPINPQ